MRKNLLLIPGALLLAGVVAATSSRPATAQAQWRPLFNGVNMNGWTSMNQGNWTVQNNYLTYTGGGNGWLRSNQEFRNFSLVATWRYTQPGNNDSGLFVRAGAEGNPWPGQGYQLNMGPGNNYGSLGGAQNAPAMPNLIKPQGQWNVYQLTVIGDQASLAINGQEAWTDARGLTRPSGYIGFQAENRPIEIAQVWILDYGTGEPGGAGAAPPGTAMMPFNGQTLAGWTMKNPAARSKWVAGRASLNPTNPGQLVVAPGSTGELVNAQGGGVDVYSNEKWGDATIELEVMVPKGSNSGIYVMGEYEVQVLDSYGKATVGPGDMGGLYGASAPRVNASRAPGEWQTYVIDYTAPRFQNGQKVSNMRFNRIVLNGLVIHENVEMKGVTPTGVTGREAATGPIMFQGDHGPVAYRNIRITPR